MQTVHGDELLGEVERRAEVVRPAVDVVGVREAPDVRLPARRPSAYTRLPSPKMPGPEAKTEYQAAAFPASRDRGEARGATFASAARASASSARRARPVRLEGQAQGLVVEELGRPLDGVDLGDLRRDHEPRHLEQLVVPDVAVAQDAVGPRRDARRPESASGGGGRLPPEGVHEEVVLAREDVVEEAEPDAPVVGEGRRLLAGPQRVDRIAGLEDGQIAQPISRRRARAERQETQLGRVVGVALDAGPGRLVMAVQLGGVPPGGHGVERGAVGAGEAAPPRPSNVGGSEIWAKRGGGDPVRRAASEPGRIRARQPPLGVAGARRAAPHGDRLRPSSVRR